MKVLIVEDQAEMRASLRAFVRASFPRAQVLTAESAASAEALCSAHSPQLVLMDICLPDGNGIELTAKFKARWPEIEIVVISYLPGRAHSDRALAAGARSFVAKNRLVSDLIPAVAEALHAACGEAAQ